MKRLNVVLLCGLFVAASVNAGEALTLSKGRGKELIRLF